MELRQHPRVNHRARPIWPPVCATRDGTKTVTGEVGVLKYVHANRQGSNTCYLVIEYQNEKFVGSLMFTDTSVCTAVSGLLKQNIGRRIKEIGDLELPNNL